MIEAATPRVGDALAGPVLSEVKKIAAGLAGSGRGSVTSGSDTINASKRCGQPESAAYSAYGSR